MGTFVPSGKDIDRKWFVVDADGQTLGRLATKAADLLSGKLNPQYVPYIDMGDHVIVINALYCTLLLCFRFLCLA
jgi:large subunit ribosomal protein L13